MEGSRSCNDVLQQLPSACLACYPWFTAQQHIQAKPWSLHGVVDLQAKAELARQQQQLGAEKHAVTLLKTQLAEAQVSTSGVLDARLHT
jgi:hypothetical protein